jgi:hypothetical protein
MKKLYFTLLAFALVSSSKAQSSDSLIVIDLAFSKIRSGHLLSNPKSYDVKDTLPFPSFIHNCHTYDMFREEFFVVLGNSIVRIDGRTGLYLDSMATGAGFSSIEANPGTNTLLGLRPTGMSGLEVYSIHILNKSVTKLSTISAISGLSGKAALDPVQARLYVHTPEGIAAINAQTGNFIDTIFDPHGVSALEVHPGTGLIYAVYFDGNDAVFCSVNPMTKVWNDIAVLNNVTSIQDISTIDIMSSRYILKTNLGTTFIRLQNGSISDTLNFGNFAAMEYINKVIVVGPNSLSGTDAPALLAYPNPASGVIKISGIEAGNAYQLWNSAGQLVQEGVLQTEGIDLHTLSQGVYQLRFSNGSRASFIKQP